MKKYLGLCLFILSFVGLSSSAQTSPNKLVFISINRTASQLHVYDVATGRITDIDRSWDGVVACSSLSPAGTHLAYVEQPFSGGFFLPAGETLKVANLETGRSVEVATQEAIACPEWFSDGQRIFYTIESRENVETTFHVFNVTSNNDQRVNRIDSFREIDFDIAPDDTYVSFMEIGQRRGQIDAFDMSSQQVSNLFSFGRQIEEQYWSPNTPNKILTFKTQSPTSEIFFHKQNTAETLVITDDIVGAIGETAWSPDGRFLVFRELPEGNALGGDLHFYTVETDSMVNLTNNPTVQELHPTWSNDGSMLAFFSNNDVMVYNRVTNQMVSAGGGNTQALLLEHAPIWSADGGLLAYIQGGNVFAFNSQTGEVLNVGGNYGVASHITWSPNGQYLAIQLQGGDSLQHVYLYDRAANTTNRLNGSTGNNLVAVWQS